MSGGAHHIKTVKAGRVRPIATHMMPWRNGAVSGRSAPPDFPPVRHGPFRAFSRAGGAHGHGRGEHSGPPVPPDLRPAGSRGGIPGLEGRRRRKEFSCRLLQAARACRSRKDRSPSGREGGGSRDAGVTPPVPERSGGMAAPPPAPFPGPAGAEKGRGPGGRLRAAPPAGRICRGTGGRDPPAERPGRPAGPALGPRAPAGFLPSAAGLPRAGSGPFQPAGRAWPRLGRGADRLVPRLISPLVWS
jgi:hypothetical protein